MYLIEFEPYSEEALKQNNLVQLAAYIIIRERTQTAVSYKLVRFVKLQLFVIRRFNCIEKDEMFLLRRFSLI